MANAISISVRERGKEMAILKVLGFRPGHILMLVLGEALAIGALAGFVSATAAYLLINIVFGGLKFPIAFFPTFLIPINALWWGLAVGAGTALGRQHPALAVGLFGESVRDICESGLKETNSNFVIRSLPMLALPSNIFAGALRSACRRVCRALRCWRCWAKCR